MTRRHALPALLAVLLLAVFALLRSPDTLQAAPEISARTLDGDEIRLADLLGRPVLVTFWATTCGSCLKEMPQLIQLYEELGGNGLEVIAVAMSYDPPNRVVELRRARQIPYPVVLDLREEIAQAFGNVRQTPTSFLIAPDGTIAAHKTGAMDMAALREQILEMFEREA